MHPNIQRKVNRQLKLKKRTIAYRIIIVIIIIRIINIILKSRNNRDSVAKLWPQICYSDELICIKMQHILIVSMYFTNLYTRRLC